MKFDPFIFKIQKYSIHDGPGIRTTLFFQGCPLNCHWCHNPESQKNHSLKSAEQVAKVAVQLIEEIEKDLIFYDESGGGVTFSGGEPLSQPQLLELLIDGCKKREIHTCIDTSGFGLSDTLIKLAQEVDLILYDIKLIENDDHVKFVGKPVSIVLENLKQLSNHNIDVNLRFPVIPGITDKTANIKGLISFLKSKTHFRDIHLLPYHKAGDGKYAALNLENKMAQTEPPTTEQIDIIKEKFLSNGFKVTIGG